MTWQLIGAGSGLAGVDVRAGEGPQVVKAASGVLKNAAWAEMIVPESTHQSVEHAVAAFNQRLAKHVSDRLQAKEKICVLGGDHSIAIGTWSGAYDALHQQGEMGLIWVDAHMDSHTPQTSETGRIHGMPLATLLGHGYSSLTTLLHQAPKFKPENVCLIGVRSYERGEADFLKNLKVKVYFMDEVRERGLKAVWDDAVKHVNHHTMGYGISLDLDAIDPTDAPGVDVPEPNGIQVDALRPMLARSFADPRLILAEIVEFDPSRDREHITERLVVSLLQLL